MTKKIFANPGAWEKIENEDLKNKTKYINTNCDVVEEIMDEEPEEIETVEDTTLDLSEEEQNKSNEVFITKVDETESENFDDVLQLTQYEGGLVTSETDNFVVAEYDKIDTANIDKKQQLQAKRFVSKITKFILDFNDVQLTEDHKAYIKQVGLLQLDNLKDMLSLVEINKQMINNIVARVNATQAEDYAIINSYNNLINQHMKLIKELSNMYKSIPSVMKKMRADVLTNQELENNSQAEEEVITEDYNETQFTNSKQMLRKILEKKEQK